MQPVNSKAMEVANQLVTRLDTVFQYPDTDTLAQCESLLGTAMHLCETVIPKYCLNHGIVDSLRFKLGHFLHYYRVDLTKSGKIYADILANNPDKDNPLSLMALNQQALVCFKQDDYTRAKHYFLQALSQCNHIYGKYSEYSIRILQHLLSRLKLLQSYDASTAYNLLGVAYQCVDDFEQASQYLQQSIAVRRKLFDDNHIDLALPMQNLGVLWYEWGQWDSAMTCFEQAYAIFTQHQLQGIDMAYLLDNMASIFAIKGQLTMALSYCRRGLKMLIRAKGINNIDVIQTLINLATYYLRLNKPARTIKISGWTQKLLQQLDAQSAQSQWPGLYFNFARAHQLLGQLAEERHYLDKAIDGAKCHFGTDHLNTAAFLHDKVLNCLASKDNQAAKAAATEAYQIRLAALGEQHSDTRHIRQILHSLDTP